MRFDPDIHNRQSIRLKHYDYSKAGAYFITSCTKNRECIFGDISDGNIALSSVGNMIFQQWHDLPNRFSEIELDDFVIMPNHIHGIICINPIGTLLAAPNPNNAIYQGAASSAPTSLNQIIRAFKSITALAGNRLLDKAGQPFWQRNYWERVIRDQSELEKTREYIKNNPTQWKLDSLNPAPNL